MRDIKDTRIEISGEGDVELLDFALREWSFGQVERNFRLFNIKRWENVQFSRSKNGKRQVWQPFRAEYQRTAAGTYTVTCDGRAFYAEKLIKLAGFTVVKVEPGTRPNDGPGAGMKMSFSCSLNGRSLALEVDTDTDTGTGE